jgi:hypothetical protein
MNLFLPCARIGWVVTLAMAFRPRTTKEDRAQENL